MNIRKCIDLQCGSGWGAERNVLLPVDTKNTPSPAIKGPAEEPTNWQMLGMTSVKMAVENNFNKHYVNPMAWVQLGVSVAAGGPGSGRRPGFGKFIMYDRSRSKTSRTTLYRHGKKELGVEELLRKGGAKISHPDGSATVHTVAGADAVLREQYGVHHDFINQAAYIRR